MKSSLTPGALESALHRLRQANTRFNETHPGESDKRQPVHTVYGGAHLFKAGTASKMGNAALVQLNAFASDAGEFANALGLTGSPPEEERGESAVNDFAQIIYDRVINKLKHEPVEDFRIDFEDGYGNRPDAEEDGHAVTAAREVAKGMKDASLPPFIGIRIKPLNEELKSRAVRTLDLFVTTLSEETNGALPANFVVTLPKVTVPEQVSALVSLFEDMETTSGLKEGSLKMQIMIETPQSILDSAGNSAIPSLVRAADGRCIAAHFGVYDYTAASNITAAYQSMTHPVCDFARHMMQVSLADTGITLSDGATNIMPVEPHRPADGQSLTKSQMEENRAVVHHAWKLNYDNVRHSLKNGFYQGWDLHPAQLPVRYAAVYSFFLEGLEAASTRLRAFMEKAAQATLIGDVFDDAATGQALLNYFLRGIACGAITEEEAQATGLTLEEIRMRSFNKILKRRRS